MKKLLLILLCLPLFYSCGKKDDMKGDKKNKNNTENTEKNNFRCFDGDCFRGIWDVYQNGKLSGSLNLEEKGFSGEFTGDFSGDFKNDVFGVGMVWDCFDGENFCMGYWIPNRRKRTVDHKEICYAFQWINKDHFILTKNNKSTLDCKRSKQ